MIVAGVDIGGTTIKVGISVKQALKEVVELPSEAEGSLESKLPEIARCVESLCIKHTSVKHPGAIGIAFPSIVDSDKLRITTQYVKFPDAADVDLVKWASDTWGIPLAMDNDARAALVGEWQYGAGQGHDNIVMCTLGTGFGSAAVCNGRLLKGAHYIGGNLGGHMTIDYRGEKCNCGGIGCVETQGSSWMLAERYGNRPELTSSALGDRSALNFKNVFEYAGQGDTLAIEIRDNAIRAWCAAVTNLLHAFDPSVLIIGGGIMKSSDIILPRIREYVDKYTWPEPGTYKILPATQTHAGVMGISYLALQALLEKGGDAQK
jgi:glucokinase